MYKKIVLVLLLTVSSLSLMSCNSETELERANKKAEQARENYEKAKNDYEELKNDLEEYEELKSKLDN